MVDALKEWWGAIVSILTFAAWLGGLSVHVRSLGKKVDEDKNEVRREIDAVEERLNAKLAKAEDDRHSARDELLTLLAEMRQDIKHLIAKMGGA